MSCIVTVCVAFAEFPDESVAVHITIVVPSGNVAVALFVMVGLGSRLSVTVAVPSWAAVIVVFVPVASNVMSAGAVTTGGMMSCGGFPPFPPPLLVTVTVKLSVSEAPLAVAFTVMVYTPTSERAGSIVIVLPDIVTKSGGLTSVSVISSPSASVTVTLTVLVCVSCNL